MTRTALTVPLLLATLTGLAGCDVQTETVTYTPQITAPLQSIVTTLDVGDVVVRPATGPAQATFVVAEASWDEERPSIDFHTEGSELFIDADCPDADPDCRVDLVLTIPPGADYEVRGEQSNIDVAGLGGLGLLGTMIGDIELDDLSGPLALKVGDGRIRGQHLTSPTVSATADDGPILLEFTDGADLVSAVTNIGAIRMAVPPTAYNIDASAGGGEVDLGVPDDRTVARRIIAHTKDGDVSIQPANAAVHQIVDLKVGQTLRFPDESIRLTFNNVVEDSRCPAKTSCVWAGRFVASMTLERDDDMATTLEITLDEPTIVYGYSVQLLDASPSPTVNDPTPDEDDYVLTLALEHV